MDVVKPVAALVSGLLLAGCSGATPQPASIPVDLPRIVDSPEPRTCTAADLERVSPWIGRILHREPSLGEGYVRPRVREQWAVCGRLDRAACARWAEEAAAKRAARDGLVAEVAPGRRDIGRLWTFELGSRVETRLFRNNGAAAAFLRTRAPGETFNLLSAHRAVEPRSYRLEIVYREPEKHGSYPMSTWTWLVPRSVAAASDALLALDDLEEHGIQVSNRWDVQRALEHGLGETIRTVAGPAEPEGPPIEITVPVYCEN